MRIDGHAHACGEYLTVESIKEKLGKNHVDMVVLAPGEKNSKKTYKMKNRAMLFPDKDILMKTNRITKGVIGSLRMKRVIPEGNDYVYSLKKQAPDMIKQFFWLTVSQWKTIEEAYRKMDFDGIKLHQCWENFRVDSPWFKEVAEFCVDKHIPLFVHLYSNKEVLKLIEFIKVNPKLKVILGHSFCMEYFLQEDRSYFDHVYFDISNSYFVSDNRIKKAYDHFGSTKLIMGSDTPYGIDALENTIKLIENLDIPDSCKENILGLNMKRLLKI